MCLRGLYGVGQALVVDGGYIVKCLLGCDRLPERVRALSRGAGALTECTGLRKPTPVGTGVGTAAPPASGSCADVPITIAWGAKDRLLQTAT